MMFDTSKSGGCTERVNYLKRGFLFYMCASCMLLAQFAIYLVNSNYWESLNFVGGFYYLMAALGQAFLFNLIPWVILYIPFTWWRQMRKVGTILFTCAIFLLNVLAYLNGIVFQLYKFHINGFVLDLAFGGGGNQVFVFNNTLVLHGVLIGLLILLFTLAVVFIAYRYARYVTSKQVKIGIYLFLFSCIAPQLTHAYAAAANVNSITEVSACLPQFYPLTANRLMLKLGVVKKEDLYVNNPDKGKGHSFVYPLHPLEKVDSVKPLNIIYLILDSWNFRTFTRECCPNIRAFGDRSAVFNLHLSSSNGTRGGIFGLFFGISATYWQDFERTGVQPLFIENLLENGYDIETFASATLVNPPFYRIVFGDVKDIRKETPGATPFDRDNRITEDFLNYLDERKDVNRPFFSFVFYDLLHAIDIPAPYRKKFQPSWDYANYLALNNNLDPEPFFNLYRNCAYYVDSLVGKVVNKLEANGLLDNSVIVITGDHGQEFNENKKNFWGHGSDFSNAQVHVPFILYYPGNNPGVYSHRTSHYDVTPTLMKRVLGVKNPAEDYSMGRDLFDPERQPFHLAGDPQNYAFIMDNVIYEKKVAGNIQVTDSLLNRLSRNQINSGLLLKAIEFKNMFLKK